MARALGQGRTDYTIQTMNAIKGQAPIRKLLQLVGTELGREFFGPDTIWIDKLVARIEHSWYTRLVNDDCRFPNEADALKNVGFTLIRIQRPEEERLESVRTSIRTADPSLTPEQVEKRLEETQNHPSETEQRFIMADITLYNNGSLSDLHDALNDVVEGRIKGGIMECKPYEITIGGA
jgi:dephospho-CoA kinase